MKAVAKNFSVSRLQDKAFLPPVESLDIKGPQALDIRKWIWLLAFSILIAFSAQLRATEVSSHEHIGIVHLKHEGLLKQFKISVSYLLFSNDWRLAVDPWHSELLEMLNQGMAQASAEERIAIAKRWTDSEATADKAFITARPQSLNRTPAQTVAEETNKTTQMFSAWQPAVGFAALVAVLVGMLVVVTRLRLGARI